MKNKIIELFRAYERETEFDGQSINEKMYNALANDILKLFVIPDVIKRYSYCCNAIIDTDEQSEEICTNCGERL